ncbi:MAG: hypothetical protein JSV24_10425 [Bacteroidales bacterium]|nr:MAG: hypothetical protein JSV24_10425 [Bacteroidales bacterium]
MFAKAIVIPPGKNFSNGISTSGLGIPDYTESLVQHASYCEALGRCGLEIIILKADLAFPDSTFVEDTAIVTDSMAIITRPGDQRRRGEEKQIEPVLSAWRKIERIAAPGCVDGGDILQAGSHFFIGQSGRTNREGADQTRSILSSYGFTSTIVPVTHILHLKSGVNYIGDETLILTEELAERKEFHSFRKIPVPSQERYAANCILVNGHLLLPSGFPETREKLLENGYNILEIDVSEFRKMDGGLSCLSLRF